MAGTPSFLRSMNERTVLELVRRRGPSSRAQVARDTGLSKPTVSLVLSSLLGAGLVREVGRSRGAKGPSAVLYELDPTAGWVVGIDVGRRWLRAAIADISGLVEMAPNLPGWGRHGIVEAVRAELGTNVTFENDVNLAALGERAYGPGRDVESFIYFWVGTGVGIGIVLEGRLYRGARGAAGEIGYLPIGPGDPHDRTTRRRGAFEEAAAAAGIVREAKRLGMTGSLSAESVFAAARRGDPIAGRVVDREARLIASAVATIAPVLDPELVILGGGVGRSGDLLLAPMERELRTLSPFRPRILLAALGQDAVLHGAIATALETGRQRVFARSARADGQRGPQRAGAAAGDPSRRAGRREGAALARTAEG
jgi:predicted NBD/HSP70 family sugar kinase